MDPPTALTGVFANGAGVINPGNLPATSGVAVDVSPTATTTYVLTVTPTSGTAIAAVATVTVASATTSSVTVDLSSSGPAVTDKLLGMNMAVWYDLVANQTGIVSAFQSAGITQVRWPGGSDSDLYHWETISRAMAAIPIRMTRLRISSTTWPSRRAWMWR